MTFNKKESKWILGKEEMGMEKEFGMGKAEEDDFISLQAQEQEGWKMRVIAYSLFCTGSHSINVLYTISYPPQNSENPISQSYHFWMLVFMIRQIIGKILPALYRIYTYIFRHIYFGCNLNAVWKSIFSSSPLTIKTKIKIVFLSVLFVLSVFYFKIVFQKFER